MGRNVYISNIILSFYFTYTERCCSYIAHYWSELRIVHKEWKRNNPSSYFRWKILHINRYWETIRRSHSRPCIGVPAYWEKRLLHIWKTESWYTEMWKYIQLHFSIYFQQYLLIKLARKRLVSDCPHKHKNKYT